MSQPLINPPDRPGRNSPDYPPETSERLSWAAIKFIRQPVSLIVNIFTFILLSGTAAVIATSFIVEVNVTAKGQAEVASQYGVREVTTGIDGLVKHVYKKIGEDVAEGELIAQLATDSATSEEIERALDDLKKALSTIKATPQPTALVLPILSLPTTKIYDPQVLQALVSVEQSVRSFQEQKTQINVKLNAELAFTNQRIEFLNNKLRQMDSPQNETTEELKYTTERINLLTQKIANLRASKDRSLLQPYIESYEDELGKLRSSIVSARNQHRAKRDQFEDELNRLKTQVLATRHEFDLKFDRSVADLVSSMEVASGVLEHFMRRHEVRAPLSGTVAKTYEVENSRVVANQPILTILPKESGFVAVIKIVSKDVVKLNKGQVVYYKVEAYPYQRFGLFQGEILSFDEVRAGGTDMEDGYVVKASIKPPPNEKPELRSRIRFMVGMKAEALVITGRKTIKDIVLDKVYNRY